MRTNRSLLTGLIIMTAATYTQAEQECPLSFGETYTDTFIKECSPPLVFGQTYVSAGANATFGGNIVATTYFVGGAETKVDGSIQSGTAITLGAGSQVLNYNHTESGTATTLGASVEFLGTAYHGTVFTLGAGNSVVSQPRTQETLHYNGGLVEKKQEFYKVLTPALNDQNVLASTMTSDITLDPDNNYATIQYIDDVGYVVVYNLDSLTTSAGIKLTLTAGFHYVFNIADMLSLGAGTTIEMSENECYEEGTCSVTWNLGGYASVGAEANMIGTVFAYGYISTGVDSVVTGGLYSATSYVTIGASGTVNGVTVATDQGY
jgi:hypothetical protein